MLPDKKQNHEELESLLDDEPELELSCFELVRLLLLLELDELDDDDDAAAAAAAPWPPPSDGLLELCAVWVVRVAAAETEPDAAAAAANNSSSVGTRPSGRCMACALASRISSSGTAWLLGFQALCFQAVSNLEAATHQCMINRFTMSLASCPGSGTLMVLVHAVFAERRWNGHAPCHAPNFGPPAPPGRLNVRRKGPH